MFSRVILIGQLAFTLFFYMICPIHIQRESEDGGKSGEATPVPIPNTEVKVTRVDGTERATVWESRSPPSSDSRFFFK